MTKDQTRHQEKDEALLRVDDLLRELRDKHNIQSLCVLVIGAGLNDNKFGEWSCQIYGTNKSGILHCAQTSIDNFMESMKDNKSKKKIVPELPDIEVPELKLPDIKLPKIEDIELPEIENLEIPELPGRGGLVLGLLRNLMPGLKITPKKRHSWIQAFKRMGAAEISRIIALSHSEIYCRRAIEQAVKEMEK
jgi:hypothetical protein